VVVSSAPQIRYPDCYGIDMAKMGDLAAFQAAISLLKETKQENIIDDVYDRCLAMVDRPLHEQENVVKDIYRALHRGADQPAHRRAAHAPGHQGRGPPWCSKASRACMPPAPAHRRLVFHRRLPHARRQPRGEPRLHQLEARQERKGVLSAAFPASPHTVSSAFQTQAGEGQDRCTHATSYGSFGNRYATPSLTERPAYSSMRFSERLEGMWLYTSSWSWPRANMAAMSVNSMSRPARLKE
jgi:hypothetical protein